MSSLTNIYSTDELDEILNNLSDSSAARGWLDCNSGSENTHPRNDLVQIAKKRLQAHYARQEAEREEKKRERDKAIKQKMTDEFIADTAVMVAQMSSSEKRHFAAHAKNEGYSLNQIKQLMGLKWKSHAQYWLTPQAEQERKER